MAITTISFDEEFVPVIHRQHGIIEDNQAKLTQALEQRLQKLDEYQRAVAESVISQNLQCISFAGTGKTTSIIAKVLKMVVTDHVNPRDIALLTFTNKAAKEMRERYITFFKKVLGDVNEEAIPIPHFSTLHSYCYKQIRESLGVGGWTILSEYQTQKIMREAIKKVLGVSKVEAEVLNRILALQEELSSNLELFYIMIPVLDVSGKLKWFDATPTKSPYFKMLSSMSSTALGERLEGKAFDAVGKQQDIRKHYLSKSRLMGDALQMILEKFYLDKWGAKAFDFSDMDLFLILYCVQHPQAMKKLQQRFKYFIQDEAQDQCCSQFVALMMSDAEVYHEIFEK